jgi:hypothetical protein
MIVAFAGARIDAEGTAEPGKFPLSNVSRVHREVEQLLREHRPTVVVGSAACGADLLVLETAGRLGIRCRVVLPFDHATFRATSVTDRPGRWGPLFDEVITAVATGDLIELPFGPDDETAYERATFEILWQCERLAAHDEPCVALMLWNGEERGPRPVLEGFFDEVKRRAWPIIEIQTNQGLRP